MMKFIKYLIRGWLSTTTQQKLGISIALLISGMNLFVLRYWALPCFFPRLNPWNSYKIEIPDYDGKIIFYRKPIHPFLAEYERKLKVTFPDGKVERSLLPVNTGGSTLINLYWVEPTDKYQASLLMKDNWGEYLIDFKEHHVLWIIKTDSERVFSGKIIDSWEGYCFWSSNDEVFCEINGKPAKEITHYKIHNRLRYIGRIDGRYSPPRFIGLDESGEECIE